MQSESILLRQHHLKYALPVFADDLTYKDPLTGVRHEWRVGLWSGDYKAWTANGVRHYLFSEGKGRWDFVPFIRPRTVRALGHKRLHIANVHLYPNPVPLPPERVSYATESGLAAALDLMAEIATNRGLRLIGIPLPTAPAEYGIPLAPDPAYPPGTTTLAPGVWMDRSRRGGRPEVETWNPSQAHELTVSFEAVRTVPDLPARLDRIEGLLGHILDRLDRMERR